MNNHAQFIKIKYLWIILDYVRLGLLIKDLIYCQAGPVY